MPTIPRTNDPAVIEHRLLDLAYTTDSMITAPLLAYYVPCSIADAERVLDRLCSEDRLRLEVDDDGNVQYMVPNRQKVARPSQPYREAAGVDQPVRRVPEFFLILLRVALAGIAGEIRSDLRARGRGGHGAFPGGCEAMSARTGLDRPVLMAAAYIVVTHASGNGRV